ncbi:SCP2 sterol-binding domain-containing protein [Actinacidiphila sp. ITFR-21]|uniref:SCP2 sterol-binding domain-containing protein n=1 Tax=Actinacidiphila sp. ITFR-21 TaxID=3075199 RepID=UPI00288C57B5|nr:SCP2 sterol-binding domain-containing protein [Streptomyces sp. ITFR-21]WNI17995.1 SCP2 sterol-binding domain-containing protein [Streptomyces sp. ITFR-21]
MSVHATAEQANRIFLDASEAALNDATFAAVLKEFDFALQLVLTDPQVALRIDKDGVLEGAPSPATVRLEGETDALHSILLGQLSIPQAIVAHRLVVKGQVSSVRKLAALLPVLGREYYGRVSQGTQTA